MIQILQVVLRVHPEGAREDLLLFHLALFIELFSLDHVVVFLVICENGCLLDDVGHVGQSLFSEVCWDVSYWNELS